VDCAEFQKFAEPYVDGEFDSVSRIEVDAHVAECGACRQTAEELKAFKAFLRRHAGQVKAPDHLRERVSKALADADRGPTVSGRHLLALAAAILLAFVVPNFFQSSITEPLDTYSESLTPILDASVDFHRRDLPVEVAGDHETIRQWFRDKVDFPVRLPEFDVEQNLSVVGARLSHVESYSAAHVVYQVGAAKVSVMLFPDDGQLDVPSRKEERVGSDYFRDNRSGYNVAVFRDNGVTYAITTDMPERSFERLVSTALFRE